ncbi:hypothetical protein GCM10027570_52030 [Streptomonospora sediminis]
MVFLDPEGVNFFIDWERIASDAVGSLRQAWGKSASRARVEAVVDELLESSTDFARMWKTHAVIGKGHQVKTVDHPKIGRITLEYHSFDIPDAHGQHLLICDIPTGGASEQGIQALGSLVDQGSRRIERD